MNNELIKLASIGTQQQYIAYNYKKINYCNNYNRYLNDIYTENFIYQEFKKNGNNYNSMLTDNDYCDLYIIKKLIITIDDNYNPNDLIESIGDFRVILQNNNYVFFEEELRFIIKLCGHNVIDNKIIINLPFEFLFKKFYNCGDHGKLSLNINTYGINDFISNIESIIGYNCISSESRLLLINDIKDLNTVTDICQTFESNYYYPLGNNSKIKLEFDGFSKGLFIESTHKIKEYRIYLNDFLVHTYTKLDFELNNSCKRIDDNLIYISFNGNLDIHNINNIQNGISFAKIEKAELSVKFEDDIDYLNSDCKVIVHSYITQIYKVNKSFGYGQAYTVSKNYSNKPINNTIKLNKSVEEPIKESVDEELIKYTKKIVI